MISLIVNGVPRKAADEDLDMSLMNWLREKMFLTGVKNGCDKGVCGSCTVIVDDKAVKSCRTKIKGLEGASVITIEGMETPDGRPHPLQQAFMDAGAVQCGFCTPGMIMKAYALLQKNSEPDREIIRKTMQGNLCRCTGYQQIVDAVELAARRMREPGAQIKAGCLT